MTKVGDEAALVDCKTLDRCVAVELRIGRFPEKLARVGDHAGANGQMGHFAVCHATGQKV